MGKSDFFKVRKAANESIEDIITVNLILDTDFARRIEQKFKFDYIFSTHYNYLCQWALNYYRKYGKAPKEKIVEVFEIESSKLKLEAKEQIQFVLENLSEEYTNKAFSTDYVYNEAVEYFDRQELLVRARNTIALVEKGQLDRARNEIRAYNEVKASLVDNGMFITPEKFYEAVDDSHGDVIFRLPGSLGRYLGAMERGWLISFLAPMKAGKTYAMVDLAVEAFLQGLKVVFFSLEMKERAMDRRILPAIVGKPIEEQNLIIPVFDCASNQDDSCSLKERVCDIGLLEEGTKNKPIFSNSDPNYTTCTSCRDNKKLQGFYKPESWFVLEKGERLQWKDFQRRRNLTLFNPKNFRRFCPPIGKVPYSYVDEVLDDLRLTEGFLPDVIVIDYADLLRSPLQVDYRHKINDIWEWMARSAVERNVLCVTASQTNREGVGKNKAVSVKEDMSAEDIRKNAHVSMMIGINRNEKHNEIERGLVRYNLLYHRFKEVPSAECLMTEQRTISRMYLDGMLVIPNDKGYLYVGG